MSRKYHGRVSEYLRFQAQNQPLREVLKTYAKICFVKASRIVER